MPIPDDPVQSAMKAIQTIIDNIALKMDKYLNAIQSYVDTVSSTVGDLEEMICKGAMQAAKYMKVLMDKDNGICSEATQLCHDKSCCFIAIFF